MRFGLPNMRILPGWGKIRHAPGAVSEFILDEAVESGRAKDVIMQDVKEFIRGYLTVLCGSRWGGGRFFAAAEGKVSASGFLTRASVVHCRGNRDRRLFEPTALWSGGLEGADSMSKEGEPL